MLANCQINGLNHLLIGIVVAIKLAISRHPSLQGLRSKLGIGIASPLQGGLRTTHSVLLCQGYNRHFISCPVDG